MSPPVRLRVLMPATYGECVAGTSMTGSLEERLAGKRQCLVFQCRLNLLSVSSQNVPGRRHNGKSPEWTVSGENPKATAPSCALDIANQGPHTCAEIADIESTPEHKRRVQQEVRGALQSLAGKGVDTREFLALLDQEDRKR